MLPLLLLSSVAVASAFVRKAMPFSTPRPSKTAVRIKILEGISDFIENFDDVVDDFMNKRMGM